jgi:alpha-L-fucosidase
MIGLAPVAGSEHCKEFFMSMQNFLNNLKTIFVNSGLRLSLMAVSLAAIPCIPLKALAVLQDSVWVVTFSSGESLESKLKKAAHVRPSPAQIKWMERERNAFMHYNMNTFHQADWGSGAENPKDFAPSAQNPDQWAQVLKNGKFSMVVPTVKHHDGFCIWNTATTSHSIKNATVTTDVIDSLHKGCVNHGVDLGIYLSPWDRYQRDTTKIWGTDAYNTYFVNQLKELLGGAYGSIGECWFDGACGDYATYYSIPWYRTSVWYDTIEALQPLSVIRLYDAFYFSGTATDSSQWTAIKQGTQKLQWRGKEIRWIGNEGGTGRTDEWCVQPVFERLFGYNQQNSSLGQESFYNSAVGAVWYQAEVNTSIAEDWFWHSQSYSPKSLSDLKTIYYNSIGNDANLLLNLLPDNRGLIPDDQITLLKNWNNWIDSTFTKNWANGATATATAEAPDHEADKIIDNKRHTYWTVDGTWDIGTSTASITFDLKTSQTFDHMMIKEYVYDGQRVAGWNLEYQDASGSWKSLVTGKKVIGYKRICKFDQVSANKVRLNITRSWDNPEISDFALYRTLSGIDSTPEDTTHPSTAIMPLARAAVKEIRPQIRIASDKLTIYAMGLPITGADIVGLDGRVIHLPITDAGTAISRPPAPGVYLVKIRSVDRLFCNKIVVSR